MIKEKDRSRDSKESPTHPASARVGGAGRRFLSVTFFICFFLGGLIISCNDDIHYSKNPDHILRFSRDTIHFDTVFTTIGTSTDRFRVYNRNSEHINITSIQLANPENSGFRVNVDGHSGTEFHDLEIRKQDSMFVFVTINVDPTKEDNPILIKDSLIFQLSNGARQDVKLLAYGQDVFILRGKVIDKDTLFTSSKPIVIYDSLRVDEGNTLTLERGTRMYFHSKTECKVYGTLKAEGSIDEPVVFRGDRLDWMFSYLPYDYISGQWGGIRFYETSYDNHLNYVDIHSAEYGIRCDSSDVQHTTLTLENSVVDNMRNDCLNVTASKILVGNTQITNARMYCVSLLGGDAEFFHCTIASFYKRAINSDLPRSGVAVQLNGQTDKPLLNADFRNCLITGSQRNNELRGAELIGGDTVQYNFYYSLVNIELNEKDDNYSEQLSHFHQGVWDNKEVENRNGIKETISREKNFLHIPSVSTDFSYDFRPDSISAAVNLGLSEDAIRYPYDRNGRSRLSDNAPDAGCYEWMEGDGDSN